jgi:hypothetical protein
MFKNRTVLRAVPILLFAGSNLKYLKTVFGHILCLVLDLASLLLDDDVNLKIFVIAVSYGFVIPLLEVAKRKSVTKAFITSLWSAGF